MPQAATIKLFLVHGKPNGLRTAELSNWSGKAIAAPRTEMPELLKRPELKSPGFYLLTGVDSGSGERAIYLGEAEDVSLRLKQHANKDFWNAATVFVSKDENLTKAHIRYLEGKLIQQAIDLDSSIVKNSVSSGAKLPESDAADMDVFLEKCLQLLPVLGVSDFSKPTAREIADEELLYCTIKGLTATGKRTPNGFIVFQGSQAVLEHRPSAKSIKIKREELIKKATLINHKDHFQFAKDTEFGSPSSASGVVTGGTSNGYRDWKDASGRTLKEIEARQTE